MKGHVQHSPRHSMTVADACHHYGFGKTTLYALIGAKHIEAFKVGARTLVVCASVERYLANLPRLGKEA